MNATALHHTSRGESTLHAGQVRHFVSYSVSGDKEHVFSEP